MGIKAKSFKQDIVINASPHDIFEAFLDSKKHSEFTDAPARINRSIGGHYSVFDGNFHGKNLELDPDKRIVQTWRSEEDEFPKYYYSTISITLQPENGGTIIHFEQIGIPEYCFDNVTYNWKIFYWEPLKKYLEK